MTWGKWVGSLCHPEDITEAVINSKKGTLFPFIHQCAEFFIKQTDNYKLYCQTALFIRVIYFFLFVFICFYAAGITSLLTSIISVIIIGVGFPIACEISKYATYTKAFWKLSFSRGWENQEVIYGAIHGIVIWICILIKLF